MALAYRYVLAEYYSEIIGFNWTLPLVSNISESNFDYYLDKPDSYLFKQLIRNNVPGVSFLEASLYSEAANQEKSSQKDLLLYRLKEKLGFYYENKNYCSYKH